ncbi:hypothetical protein [Pseudoduganella albidiflava]|uniref:DUF4142 domain-containing protein n=1 Tax=Pseudoduganella albidiflava TaxID=321983 RepID=A0A411X6G2_9BURK|nr:hypothetical protein [Pseudoduganella albidiflava]QBI04502.1 hypothetical protein EYF70_29510 [Pseudoduganella albidiflava]GGY27801.1 hypothetical protein GCM10007387_07330 [Pseudoduganella albidiflava]
MKLFRTISAVLLAVGIACSGAAGAAKLDPDHYLLTKDVFTKLKAIEVELEKSGYQPKDDDDDEDNGKKGKKDNGGPTAEEVMRKIESDKVAMATLKRHNLSSRDYALTMLAMFHAGFYVMFEESMDKKGAADLLATFTKEQRANVAFVRAMNLQKKK